MPWLSTAPDQAGSLAVGLAAAAAAPDAILVVTPVDALPARVETIAALLAAVREGADAATPRHDGARGHPVVLRAAGARGPIARSPTPYAPRSCSLALDARGARCVDVDDPAVTTDLDTPADVVRVTLAPPRFWG